MISDGEGLQSRLGLVVMRLRSLIMPMRDWGGDGDVACLGDKIQTGSAMLL